MAKTPQRVTFTTNNIPYYCFRATLPFSTNNSILKIVGSGPFCQVLSHIYIYMDTNPITLPCSLARAGNNRKEEKMNKQVYSFSQLAVSDFYLLDGSNDM